MKQLRLAYSKKEKAEKLLSNLEELKEQGSVTVEHYQSLKQEYEKFLEDAISEVEQIKTEIIGELKKFERNLESLKHDLSNFEARFKVGELPAKNYEKIGGRTQSKIKQTQKKISQLQSLIDSKSSEDIGGYIEVGLRRREGKAASSPAFYDKLSSITDALHFAKPDRIGQTSIRRVEGYNENSMRIGAMVLGIIGGIFALLMGLIEFTIGQIGGAVGAKGAWFVEILSLVIPIVGLVGGTIVKGKALVGGILMLASAIAIFVLVGINLFSLLPGIPLLIGGILGLVVSRETY